MFRDLRGGPKLKAGVDPYEHPERAHFRYVAVIDILGFRQLMTEKKLEELASTLDNTLFNALLHSGHLEGRSASYEGFDEGDCRVSTRLMSDTLVLWTDNSSKSAFRSLIWATGQIVAQSILDGFPLRGAISAGPLFVEQKGDILVGPALVQAYRLEQSQQWAGVAVDGWADFEADEEIPNIFYRGILGYRVPTKWWTRAMPLAVDWPLHIDESVSWDNVVKNWPTVHTRIDRAKKQNSEAFFEFSRTTERFGFHPQAVRNGPGLKPRSGRPH